MPKNNSVKLWKTRMGKNKQTDSAEASHRTPNISMAKMDTGGKLLSPNASASSIISFGLTNSASLASDPSKMSSMMTVKTIPTENQLDTVLRTRDCKIVKMIGEGGFASVYLVFSAKNNANMACKVFDLTNPNTNREWVEKCLKNEMYIARKLTHPNIVLTYQTIKTHRFGIILMKYAVNGNIKTELYERKQKPYSEEQARQYFTGLMTGLKFMHNMNIAHRDLKLDNFLLSDTYTPMIADFGFAALGVRSSLGVLNHLMRVTRCGTQGYMAPEVFNRTAPTDTYDAKAVDIFAMGVCLYEMLNCCTPFPGDNSQTTVSKVLRQEIVYHNVGVSQTCRQLISSMLTFQPSSRPKADTVAKHHWVTNNLINFFANL